MSEQSFIQACHKAVEEGNLRGRSDDEFAERYQLLNIFRAQYNPDTDPPMEQYLANRMRVYDNQRNNN